MLSRDTLRRLLRDVIHGEGRAPGRAGLHAAEDGMFSFVAVLAILFFIFLVGLVANVSYVTKEKVEVQNGADAVALSAATWQARGLNAVTAANHLMGQLTALCVMHHALGGPEMDEGKQFSTNEDTQLNTQLSALQNTAKIDIPAARSLVQSMTQHKHKAGATLYDSRELLKYWTVWTFVANGAARILDATGIGAGVAAILDALAMGLRLKIRQEWLVLDGIENVAGNSGTVQARKLIENQVIPLIKLYSDMVVQKTPKAIEQMVPVVAKANALGAADLHPKPAQIKLPLETEKKPSTTGGQPPSAGDSGDQPELVGRLMRLIRQGQAILDAATGWLGPLNPTKSILPSVLPPGPDDEGYAQNPSRKKLPKSDWAKVQQGQWVRATYPWVNAWRAPVRGAMQKPLLMMAMSSTWYLHWTNKYTLAKSHEIQTRSSNPVQMYVLTGTNANGVGRQTWTKREGSREADRLFTVVGFGGRKVSTVASPGFYGQPNKEGVVAYAQAMVYNANAQNPGNTGGGDFQPEVGWDTLNWHSPVNQSDAHAYGRGARSSGTALDLVRFLGDLNSVQHPVVRLNWQAKLTPVTRLSEAAGTSQLDERFRRILRKLSMAPQLHNH